MADVFISYSSKDRERAEQLAKVISGGGFSVWWDRQIPLGKSYDVVIKNELAEATCVIVLWSNQSVQSDFVKDEAEFGKRKGNLIPVLIDAIDIPFGFGRLQTINLSECDLGQGRGNVGRLVAGIKDVVAGGEECDPAPLQTTVHQAPAQQAPVQQAQVQQRPAAPAPKKSKAGMALLAVSLMAAVMYIAFDLYGSKEDKAGDGTTSELASETKLKDASTEQASRAPVTSVPGSDAKSSSQKTALFIDTNPANASVKILNIKPKYKAGIELGPGAYKIRVSAVGHETRDFKIVLTGKQAKTQRHVELARLNKNPEMASLQANKQVAVATSPNSGSRQPTRQSNARGGDVQTPGMDLAKPPALKGVYTSVQNMQPSPGAQSPTPAGNGNFEVAAFINSINSGDSKQVIKSMEQSQRSGQNPFAKTGGSNSQLLSIATKSGLLAEMVTMGQRMSMQRIQVTKSQWQKVMGSQFKREHEYGFYDANDPVIAQWSDVNNFLRTLNQKMKGSGYAFRLPAKTELKSAIKANQIQFPDQSGGEWTKARQVVERISYELHPWQPSDEGRFRVVRIANR